MTDAAQSYALGDFSPPRIPTFENVTPELFASEIQSARKPIVMKGVVRDWAITRAAQESPQALASMLKRHASQKLVSVNLKEPSTGERYFYKDGLKSCNFGRRSVPLAVVADQLLQQMQQAAPMGLYMDAAPAADLLPGFMQQHPMHLAPQDTEPRLWLGNSARVAPHFDVSENIACVVSGQRQFLLFPPEQVGNLYMGPLENTPGGAPVSMVDPRDPDLGAYPKYAEAMRHAMLAKLEPGDAIYIPRLWWHYVEASGPFNLLVNYWWDSPAASPMSGLILAARTLRRLPVQDRAAMRAFFEHFVFSKDADAAFDHIPEDARGVMGPDTEAYDRVIQPILASMISEALSE